ncbi:MAG TPA: hypothetical protein VMZ04_03750 [Anaerolineae bacterium]|nr:hypothetical protein [Anaerolineae bacterium]
MAIQLPLTKDKNEYYFDFLKVYFKIDELFIEPVRGEISIGVRGYPNAESRHNGGIGIYKKVFTIPYAEFIMGDDLIESAYLYLKTLPEFEKGVDV